MIGLRDYFGPHWGAPEAEPYLQTATDFLSHVSMLMSLAEEHGVVFRVNPHTGSQVSGSVSGGWRPPWSKIGAPGSAHRQGQAVDIYDPDGQIDAWCMSHLDTLREIGLYLEHPEATPGWSHWTTRRPPSGRVVFRP